MMIISLGGLQNVMFSACFICSSAENVCMDSMAWGGISPSLCDTICLAESERISSMVTCRRESGRGVPSMTHKVWARVVRLASTVRIIQVRILFSFFIIFYSSRLFISIKKDGLLALVADGFDFLEHSRACGKASPRSIGEWEIGGEMVHNAHVSGTMDEDISSACIVV